MPITNQARHGDRSERHTGDTLPGGYEIFDVRRGGMGVVYCVKHSDLAYCFAVKTFQDKYVRDNATVKRFLREGEAWIRLGRHPNLVQAFMVEIIDNKPHLFLEYVAGGSLKTVIAHSALPIPRILDIALQICDGMIHIQRTLGFVHRDLKPDNLLLTANGRVQITDFGLISSLNPASTGSLVAATAITSPVVPDLTVQGGGMGTPTYMAPEQWRGAATIKSDIYSFGIVLYEMLCGKPPFVLEAGEPLYVLNAKHVTQLPINVRTYRGDVPERLCSILDACLEKSPDRRPSGFGNIQNALLDIYHEAVGRTWQPSPYDQLPSGSQATAALLAGMSLAALGNHTAALAEVKKALAAEPGNALALLQKGKNYHFIGEHYQALACFECIHNSLPDDEENNDLLARCLNTMKHYNRALDCARRVTELAPHNFSGWNNMAVALAGLAHKAEVNALGNEEDAGALHTYTVGFCLACESLSALDKAIQIAPDNPEIWNNRGYLLGRCGYPEDAIDTFIRSVELNPRYMQPYLNMSEILFAIGRETDAFHILFKANKIDPDNAQVRDMVTFLSEYLKQKGIVIGNIITVNNE